MDQHVPTHSGLPVRLSMLSRADALVSTVEGAMLALSAALVVLLMVMGLAEVVARSVFNKPLIGYIDLVGLMTSAVAFLALSHCQQAGKHIRMELLVTALRGRLKWFAEFLGTLLALVVVTMLLSPTWQHALRSMVLGDSTMDLQLPMWPSKLLIPIALATLWLRLVINAWGFLRLFRSPVSQPLAVPLHEHVIGEEVDLADRRDR
jgi:TRAP-type mannitol/chloroaromatic compound transport system permease small subunit